MNFIKPGQLHKPEPPTVYYRSGSVFIEHLHDDRKAATLTEDLVGAGWSVVPQRTPGTYRIFSPDGSPEEMERLVTQIDVVINNTKLIR